MELETKRIYVKTAGTFECEVLKPSGGWLKKIGKKETEAIVLDLRVVKGDLEGMFLSWTGYLTEKAAPYTTKTLAEIFDFDGSYDRLVSGDSTLENGRCQASTELKIVEGDLGNKEFTQVKYLNKANYVHQDGGKPLEEESLIEKLSREGRAIATPILKGKEREANDSLSRGARADKEVF